MADVDISLRLRAWRAIMQIGEHEETLMLDLPGWMDKWDARDQFHAEAMNVYDDRGVILDLQVI